MGLQKLRVASMLVGLLGVLDWSASGAAAIITVNVLTDTGGESCPTSCSLRAALATAGAGDEIQSSVTGTILLSQGQLVVDKKVTITGPGASR
jgi:CSLREA domain-containing protein